MRHGSVVHRFLVGKPDGKRHWGDQDTDGTIILRWIFRKWEGFGYWMKLVQDRDRWRALVMNLRVPKMRGIS